MGYALLKIGQGQVSRLRAVQDSGFEGRSQKVELENLPNVAGVKAVSAGEFGQAAVLPVVHLLFPVMRSDEGFDEGIVVLRPLVGGAGIGAGFKGVCLRWHENHFTAALFLPSQRHFDGNVAVGESFFFRCCHGGVPNWAAAAV